MNKHKNAKPFIFGFAGWSGSGKTTLAEKIIAKAAEDQISISTVKHAHHNFDADQEGKDSYRHRKAGAQQVLVASDKRMALFTEKQVKQTPELDDLLSRLDDVNWVLVEGFKKTAFPKIEIYDPALSKDLLCETDKNIIAIVGQDPLPQCDLPSFHRDDVDSIYAFLKAQAQSIR